MKHRRLLLPGLALVALVGSGCFLISGQIMIHFAVGNVTVANPSAVNGVYVDLTTIADYNDNKDKLEDLSDLALLGTFTNNGVSALDVEVWVTGSATGTLSDTQVRAQGTRLWGPFALGAGETKTIGWDASAGLFQSAGKDVLISETKGDGDFTIYAIGAVGTYNLSIADGVLVLVLDAKN
jgi:hypothetical protein